MSFHANARMIKESLVEEIPFNMTMDSRIYLRVQLIVLVVFTVSIVYSDISIGMPFLLYSSLTI